MRGQIEHSLPYFERAIELEPDSPEALQNREAVVHEPEDPRTTRVLEDADIGCPEVSALPATPLSYWAAELRMNHSVNSPILRLSCLSRWPETAHVAGGAAWFDQRNPLPSIEPGSGASQL